MGKEGRGKDPAQHADQRSGGDKNQVAGLNEKTEDENKTTLKRVGGATVFDHSFLGKKFPVQERGGPVCWGGVRWEKKKGLAMKEMELLS